MKFNFEKVVQDTKKILVRGAVATASLLPLEKTNAQQNLEINNQNKTEINQNSHLDSNKKELNKQKNQEQRLEKIKEIEKDLGISKENDSLNDPEYHRNEYLKYMEHPSYKQRLTKEMYGDKILDEEMRANVEYEYKERLEQLQSVPVQINERFNPNSKTTPEYNIKDNKVKSNIEAVYHEISHAVEKGRHISRGFEETMISLEAQGKLAIKMKKLQLEKSIELNKIMSNEIYKKNHQDFINLLKKHINKNINSIEFKTNSLTQKLNNVYETQSVGVMDFLESFNLRDSHPKFNANLSNDKHSFKIEEDLLNLKESIPVTQSNFIKNNNELLKRLISYETIQDSYDKKIRPIASRLLYLKKGTEVRARLNHLRMKAVKKYNFDLNKDFNINDFERLKDDPQYNNLKKELGFSDEQINELMKYTAMNDNGNTKNNKNYIHTGWNYEDRNDKA